MIQSTKKEQIYKLLKERIERRVYVPGSRLPKEVELSAELGVSRKTLRPVLEQLAMENLIERVKGKGTFIRDAEESRTKILVIVHDSSDISNPFLYIMPGVQLAAENLNISLESCSVASLLSRPADESARQILENG
ncbi:MAG: winged helix-turn-helix domain-containing protein, partial [Victivallales bacterium]